MRRVATKWPHWPTIVLILILCKFNGFKSLSNNDQNQTHVERNSRWKAAVASENATVSGTKIQSIINSNVMHVNHKRINSNTNLFQKYDKKRRYYKRSQMIQSHLNSFKMIKKPKSPKGQTLLNSIKSRSSSHGQLVNRTLASASTNVFPCQTSRNVQYYSYEEYAQDTCTLCFRYMVKEGFRKEFTSHYDSTTHRAYFVLPYFYYVPNNERIATLFNITETYAEKKMILYNITLEKLRIHDPENDPILKVFVNEFYRNIFVNCCEEAIRCCNDILMSEFNPKQTDQMCSAKWDGWMCWNSAKPGQTLTAPCPDAAFQSHGHLPAYCFRGNAEKTCNSNGTWYHIQNRETTDYSKCSIIGQEIRIRRSKVKYVLQSVSIVSILIAIAIYIVYRQYRLVRVQIHLNFFASFLFTSVSTILLNAFVLDDHLYNYDTNLLKENPVWCRIMYVLFKYGRLSNYFWMLCEGIYLHQLIVQPFQQKKVTIHFYLIGWITPLLVMIPFTMIHGSGEHNKNCWTDNGSPYLEWLFLSLPIFCWLVNTILLINITRVLFRKLTHTVKHVRAAQKATATLLPVFGVHYIFYLIQPEFLESCHPFLDFLHYCGLAIDSLHGFAVVTIFCFCNAEVHALIRRTIRRKLKISEMLAEDNDINKF